MIFLKDFRLKGMNWLDELKIVSVICEFLWLIIEMDFDKMSWGEIKNFIVIVKCWTYIKNINILYHKGQ